MNKDSFYMAKALDLARKAEGYTHPNPPVGAVITKKGAIIGRGFHRRAGMPHAEIEAIRNAGGKVKGSTLFVTLEPCSTVGLTPACTDAIIKAGIRRVVIGVKDPNPKHHGRAMRLLENAGLQVVLLEERKEYIDLIAPFCKWIRTGLPRITLKLAMTIDGRIADAKGTSRWITGVKSRAVVQDLRRRSDAIMIGGGTAIADDPSLLTASRNDNSLARIIVDSTGRVSYSARVFSDASAETTILATTNRCPNTKIAKYTERGAKVWTLQSARGRVSIPRLLKKIGSVGLTNVLCEGGGELAYSLIDADAVDEYVIFIAPKILGGKSSVPSIGGDGWSLRDGPELDFVSVENVGSDIMINALPRRK